MDAPWPFLVLAGVLGLAVGSFLNVVIYRVPRDESIVSPGSHCPRCDSPIKARHNVPVLGWLVLHGRCASCALPISVRYPLVEAGTGALFTALTALLGLRAELPAYLYLAAAAVTLVMIDFDLRRLPTSIVAPSYVVAILLLTPATAAQGDWTALARSGVGIVALGAVFLAVAFTFQPGVDPSDAAVAGLLGLYLGWWSWSALVLGAIGCAVIAAAGTRTAFRRTAVSAGSPAGSSATTSTAAPVAAGLIVASLLTLFVAAPVSAWCGALITA